MNTYPSSFVPSSMVSPQDSHSNPSHLPTTPPFYSPSSVSCTKIQRSLGRSMRTVRSNLYQTNHNTCSFPGAAPPKSASACVSENLTDSVVDLRLGELAGRTNKSVNSSSSDTDFFDLSQAFSDFSVCSSDISGELQRLATIPAPENLSDPNPQPVSEPCAGFLDRDSFSTEIIESISPEDLQPTVKICIDGLRSPSTAVKRSAAAKLRLLAKNRSDNRALIGESGAVPALIPLLRCTDPMTQEHAVTALLNLSLLEENKARITSYGAIKALIYVLKTGTETSKQNAACALLNLSLIDENKISIGACGAIPPLITLLMNGSNRGKKDAMTTLYKLCTVKVNKERAVKALYYYYLVGKGGELTHDETTIISGALDLTQKTTKDAMTPLSEIFSLDLNSKLDKDTMSLIMSKGHSCIPVYSGSPSNIIGLILVKNLIKCRAEDETPIRILTIGRIPRVEDSLPLYDILNQFQKGHSHMAAVVKSKHNVKDTAGNATDKNDMIMININSNSSILQKQAEGKGIEIKQQKSISTHAPPSVTSSDTTESQSPALQYIAERCSDSWNLQPKKGGEQGDANKTKEVLESLPDQEEEVIGIITMEDVLEELLQEEILDETDEYVDVHNKWLPSFL